MSRPVRRIDRDGSMPSNADALEADSDRPTDDGGSDQRRNSESSELRDAKLEAMAEFAAGAGHEINNPLAAISGRAQLLLQDETDPERRRHLTTIGAQALRIRDMIGDAMLFARPPQPNPVVVTLTTVVDRVRQSFADALTRNLVSLNVDGDEQTTLWADETQLAIVISELLRNAIRFSSERGSIHLSWTLESTEFVCIEMKDSGPGLTSIEREHLFDPFFSGRQAGRGLGFGLPKCWRIVTMHGGSIDVQTTDSFGFTMVVRWPTPSTIE